jgi:SAM-dependent methyltransferase
MAEIEQTLAEQAHYYRERAGEYDDWWFRRGRYDHGTQATAEWNAEAREVEGAIDALAPLGDVLELACGTGLWTRYLAPRASKVTALDASAEVLELARARVGEENVSYLQADLFAWEPERRYDLCFFGFWLSHVPAERFAAFWAKVRRVLAPGGRVLFLDSLRNERASAAEHQLPDGDDETTIRRLEDGREFRIVKRFYEPRTLERELADLGWRAQVRTTGEFFLYGQAIPLGSG